MAVFKVSLTDAIDVSGDAEIDLETYAKALFNRTCKDIRNGPQLSAQDREAFQTQVAAFTGRLQDIGKIADKRLRDIALDAAAVALALGFYRTGNGADARRLKDKIMKAHTEAALAVRRKNDFQEIVAREAKALWGRNPKFKGKAKGTAEVICDPVARAIAALQNPSKGLTIPNLSDVEERRKFIDRVRKRVKRLKPTG
jgi:hypothetical protein